MKHFLLLLTWLMHVSAKMILNNVTIFLSIPELTHWHFSIGSDLHFKDLEMYSESLLKKIQVHCNFFINDWFSILLETVPQIFCYDFVSFQIACMCVLPCPYFNEILPENLQKLQDASIWMWGFKDLLFIVMKWKATLNLVELTGQHFLEVCVQSKSSFIDYFIRFSYWDWILLLLPAVLL